MTSLENTQFTQNSSFFGGAIFGENAQILGNNLTIDQNDAFGGGGVYLITSTLTLTNSTLSRNIADDEASTLVTAWGNGSFTNVTVSGNEVGGTGVTIYIQEQDYSITHSTIVSNTAPNGAIYIQDDTVIATLKNSIVANNSGGNCGGFMPVSAGYNLESANDCGLSSTGDLTNEDPHLGSLQNNGGATFTHALFPNSFAIDNGDGALSFDQRGAMRPQGDRVDIGAFEIEQHSLTVENIGAGDGVITSIPVGINCGGTCVETFVSNTAVSLTATVGDDTVFVGWDGAGCSGTGECVVTMDGTKMVTATFANHYQSWLPIILKP